MKSSRCSASLIILTTFAFLASLYLTGCSTLEKFGVKYGTAAIMGALSDAAQQELSTGKVDWGHALSASLWRNATSALNDEELYASLDADTGGQLPKTTKATVRAVKRAVVEDTPRNRAAAIHAAAKTVSEVSTRLSGQ